MIRIGIVGAGKIARDQHVPALLAHGGFDLAGTADPDATLDGVAGYPDLATLLAAVPELDAICICTPPLPRFALAEQALLAGKHVLLEKPPGATLSEIKLLRTHAGHAGRALYAPWHSRYAPAVAPAAAWIAERRVARVTITWTEDVKKWHPGQVWIWQAGGFGVFDPGINALSIATTILPPFFLQSATLSLPSNTSAPIAAVLHGRLDNGAPIDATFDFRQTGEERWDILVDTDDARSLHLLRGGSVLHIDGQAVPLPASNEYRAIYDRFAALIESGGIDVDTAPLAVVADAFLLGQRVTVQPFEE